MAYEVLRGIGGRRVLAHRHAVDVVAVLPLEEATSLLTGLGKGDIERLASHHLT